MAVQRAYGDAEKIARRQAILDAAERLYAADFAAGLPSVARIADAASLAKGTVYLYFDTKEDIFAALLLTEWNRVLGALAETLAGARSANDAVTAFLRQFIDCLEAAPLLMQLDALENSVLGPRMSSAAVRDFKAAFHDGMSRISRDLEASLDLPAGRGSQLLTRTHALTRGLWQSLSGPDSVADTDAAVGARPAFGDEVTEALAEYWCGALHHE